MDELHAVHAASEAKDELRSLLADYILDGTVATMTVGSITESNGSHVPSIVIRVTSNVVAFRKMRAALVLKAQPVSTRGVSVTFAVGSS